MIIYSFLSIFLLKFQNLFRSKKGYLLVLILLSTIPAFYNSNITLDIGLTDAYVYKMKYLNLTMGGLISKSDVGFEYFSLLLAKFKVPLFLYFFVISLFQISIMYKFISKYSSNPTISMIIYNLTFYNQHNFNIIRQGMAVSFTIIAMDFLITNKKAKSIFFAIVAVLFHKSAIIFFISYIFKRDRNIKSKYYVIGLIYTLIISIGFSKFINKLVIYLNKLNLFGENFNNNTIGNFFIEYRMTYLYTLALLFLLIITFLLIKSLPVFSTEQYFIFKIFYIGVIFTMLFSSSVIFRRFGNYFLIYQCILIPNIISIFKEKHIVEYGLLLLLIVQAMV